MNLSIGLRESMMQLLMRILSIRFRKPISIRK